MTDAVLKQSVLKHFIDSFGHVQTERFISLINKEPFDYTEWQRDLFEGMTIEELSSNAMENRRRKRAAQTN
ncbi:MAG: hypothetical protein FWB80_02500 [Defluviitaleaceae bacterium]|nr:hypothetical protein [Defluviitaleaceae bacterium]